jgi:hypothetical protein
MEIPMKIRFYPLLLLAVMAFASKADIHESIKSLAQIKAKTLYGAHEPRYSQAHLASCASVVWDVSVEKHHYAMLIDLALKCIEARIQELKRIKQYPFLQTRDCLCTFRDDLIHERERIFSTIGTVIHNVSAHIIVACAQWTNPHDRILDLHLYGKVRIITFANNELMITSTRTPQGLLDFPIKNIDDVLHCHDFLVFDEEEEAPDYFSGEMSLADAS